MNKQNSGGDILELFPHGWAILLIAVLPGVAFYYHQNRLALILFVCGIAISTVMVTQAARGERRSYVPRGLTSSRLSWVRQSKIASDRRSDGKISDDLRKELYPFVVFCIVLAWWMTRKAETWMVLFVPAALQGGKLVAIFLLISLVLVAGLSVSIRMFPIRKLLTVFYALLFLATLLGYYTQTLHQSLEPLGWELTVLAQRGNWQPTPWPLALAGLCFVMIGTALSAWPQARRRAWSTLLQETAVRSPIFLLWVITSVYILGRAMLALYSPLAVYSTTIGILIVLFILFAIDIDLRTPIETVGTILRLLLVVLAIPFYALLLLLTKFGDLLLHLHMRFMRPMVIWLDKLRNWVTLQIEVLRIYRDWLIMMIFDPSRDDLFKHDHDIRDLADAELLE